MTWNGPKRAKISVFVPKIPLAELFFAEHMLLEEITLNEASLEGSPTISGNLLVDRVVGAAQIISIIVCFVANVHISVLVADVFVLYFCVPPYWGDRLVLVAGVVGGWYPGSLHSHCATSETSSPPLWVNATKVARPLFSWVKTFLSSRFFGVNIFTQRKWDF